MAESDSSTGMLSFCGLYCANCAGYRGLPLLGKCPGCQAEGGPPDCVFRECCRTKGFGTCAECELLDQCEYFDRLVHKLARVVFGNDKRKNLLKIKEVGVEAFVQDRMLSGKT